MQSIWPTSLHFMRYVTVVTNRIKSNEIWKSSLCFLDWLHFTCLDFQISLYSYSHTCFAFMVLVSSGVFSGNAVNPRHFTYRLLSLLLIDGFCFQSPCSSLFVTSESENKILGSGTSVFNTAPSSFVPGMRFTIPVYMGLLEATVPYTLGLTSSQQQSSIKTTAFWNMGLCFLVEVDRRFRSAYCLHQ
jgi:hypothetical protein